MVEAANARIKRWKYLDHILPTSQIPYIGDLFRELQGFVEEHKLDRRSVTTWTVT